jgi:hypothetical protein
LLCFRPRWQNFLPLLLAGCSSAPPQVLDENAKLVASCEAALVKFQQQGLVESQPLPIRAEVDDALWATLSEEKKNEVLQALTCFAFEGEKPRRKEYAVIYGADTGQRLAVMDGGGPQVDAAALDVRTRLPDFGQQETE